MKTLLVALNAKFIHSSLALRCLKKGCDRAGIPDVVTAEYTINNQVSDILRHIYDQQAQVIGFSCYIWNITMIWHLIGLIRQVMPEVRIFAGGPEVSYTARQILEEHKEIDYIVQGEGEEAVPALLQCLAAGRSAAPIPGVMGREEGRLCGMEGLAEVRDLNSLDFPYEGEDFSGLAHKIIYYETSRGCPFHCQYCLSGNDDQVRFVPAQRAISELEQFVQAGVHQVKFVDRTFNCQPCHYRPLLEYMISVRQPVNFHLEIEPGLLTDEDLELLGKAPKRRIQLEIGIQSTYGPTLRAIRRHNDWNRITHIMKVLRQMDTIHLHLDLIVGLPYEDYEHLRRSFHDIYALQPHKLQIGFLKLLQGSGIRRDYPQQYRFDPEGPYEVLETDWLPYSRIRYLKVFEDVFERIYNSGKFTFTLAYMDQFFTEDYYALYEGLTDYWLVCGYDRQAISDEGLYQFVWQFIQKLLPELTATRGPLLQELLSLDMLTFFRFRLKPFFPGWQEAGRELTDPLWRDETWLRRYVPEYTFTSWRDIKMRFHLWKISEALRGELRRYMPIPDGAAWLLGEKRQDGIHWTAVTI